MEYKGDEEEDAWADGLASERPLPPLLLSLPLLLLLLHCQMHAQRQHALPPPPLPLLATLAAGVAFCVVVPHLPIYYHAAAIATISCCRHRGG